ncbi:MAG: 50S ribosomal protein L19 [Alphaproteobacteria bacterium]|nr:50S ribosomal protein L19 [Alphaproteobacteria bacterium]
MSIVLANFEKEQIEKLSAEKAYPNFTVGDTINVRVKIGDRFQNYEGVCIAIKNRGLNSAFTVRKLSYGEGVERVFPYYTPNVDSIKIIKRGKVRRAKLYYLKDRLGKSAKISEDTTGYKMKLDNN